MKTEIAQWIAVDWGTSNLRAWVFGAGDVLIKTVTSDQGMGQLSPDGFEPALMQAIGGYLGKDKTPVICCGMVGARQGWQEAPYSSVPCTVAAPETAVRVATRDSRLDVYILPGVSQDAPADVMRGEETQIAGFLADNPRFDGVLCLPGTHTKWVHISAEEIVSFRTFMTGELFALMSQRSVLKHSVQSEKWDSIAFELALSDTISAPQLMATRLFSLRAEGLLHGLDPTTAKARLSGMLIGLELAGARPYWLGQNIALIGDPKLTGLYETALNLQHAMVTAVKGDDMALAGLKAAYNRLIRQENAT